MNAKPRYYVIGSDTATGKTTVMRALLAHFGRQQIHVFPYKPAESYGPGDIPDSKLLADLSDLEPASIATHRAPIPRAPGMAISPEHFLEPENFPPTREPLQACKQHLASRLDNNSFQGALIEAAGGLHVPMPGGTWQAEWIKELADAAILVTHLGLGTINHTLLTIEACRARSIDLAGLIFCDARSSEPSLAAENRRVLQIHAGVPILGFVPAQSDTNARPLIEASPVLDQLFVSKT
jgi:dethiobiotin synthetase